MRDTLSHIDNDLMQPWLQSLLFLFAPEQIVHIPEEINVFFEYQKLAYSVWIDTFLEGERFWEF